MLLHCGAGTCSGAKGDVAWSGTVTVPLSVSPVVAQRLRKLDFPVKDSEAPSAPGADKNHFPRPRGPGEDAGEAHRPSGAGGFRGGSRSSPAEGSRCSQGTSIPAACQY